MADACERDHQEMRREATATQVALASMSKDLETVRAILAGMTGILQENLVTVSIHDKASQDWRETLLSKAENALARVDQIERTLEEGNRFHEGYEDMREAILDGLGAIQTNGTLLRQILGLEASPNPTPLARDLKEVLAMTRTLDDRDPDTGRETTGWAWWSPRVKEAWSHGVALAVLAYLIHKLLPYLALK